MVAKGGKRKKTTQKYNRRRAPKSTKRSRAYARSQLWDKLGEAATSLGNKAYSATKTAGTAIARGTIKAGQYAGKVIKEDIAYHRTLRETSAKKRSARIAFAKRNRLRIDGRPGYEDVYYTISGIPIVVDVMNPDEVRRAEADLRGHLLGGSGYTPYYGSGRDRVIIIQR